MIRPEFVAEQPTKIPLSDQESEIVDAPSLETEPAVTAASVAEEAPEQAQQPIRITISGALLEAAQAGDEAARYELGRRALIIAKVTAKAHGSDLPYDGYEDVAMDAVANIFAYLPKIRADRPGDLAAYISRTTRNAIIDRVRRDNARPKRSSAANAQLARISETVPETQPAYQALAESLGAGSRLHEAMAGLSELQRQVVFHSVIGDMSRKQVTELLGCTFEEMKNGRHRGLALMRQWLEQHPDPEEQ